ncbi:unnamed protein product [Callosobruchus maculatus]|uniref:Sulfhydryl oxidase n=1 Tax=Callosobruchus maculatus TaxID=64391 RepID=A0A653BNW3_CALMS|nr:unnamed protein product [Callosobruchus maculatus]
MYYHNVPEIAIRYAYDNNTKLMNTLNNQLYAIVYREIGANKEIRGEQLQALRLYVDVLDKYFPFGSEGKVLLKEIKELVHNSDPVNGLEIRKKIIEAVSAASDNNFQFLHENIALRAMHGYIKNFFGCRECSNHFQEMSSRRNIFNVPTKERAVCVAMEAHNEVNNRLRGDLTEDPEFPKNPFPYRQSCPKCQKPNGQWDEDEVYKYLKNMYDRTTSSI